MVSKKIAEVLKKEGVFTKEISQRYKDFEKVKKGSILDFCAENGIMPANGLINLLRQSYLLPVVDLTQMDIDLETVRLLPSSLCFEHNLASFYSDGVSLSVAMTNPDNDELVDFIKQKTGLNVIPYLAQQSAIKQILQQTFNHSASDSREYILGLIDHAKNLQHSPEVMAQQVPIISLVNHLIIFALRSHASDLHVEPREDTVFLRFRIDGQLHELFTLPRELLAPIIARIKILARLRIDENMRPQDGRFSFSEAEWRIAVRVSIIPTLYGQKAALRFLDTDNEQLSLDSLGLETAQKKLISQAVGQTSGLILVTGPTGSGKTTTLYALLKSLSGRKVNISTIEDPIEYHLRGANQMQVNPQVNLNFADGLRSLLRQDPDVIMVGEIRDRETASIAINAALTGHLVFSSLHTNSAAAAIPRLVDMGVEPFLIASTLRLVVGQRLVRRVCHSCRREYTVDKLPEAFNFEDETSKNYKLVAGQGCPECLQTGYHGRTGIFEIMSVGEDMHDLIMSRAPAGVLQNSARRQGMKTLVEDGLRRVLEHETTPEEIIRLI
jgi:type IV pilus assembly protein PilB